MISHSTKVFQDQTNITKIDTTFEWLLVVAYFKLLYLYFGRVGGSFEFMLLSILTTDCHLIVSVQ